MFRRRVKHITGLISLQYTNMVLKVRTLYLNSVQASRSCRERKNAPDWTSVCTEKLCDKNNLTLVVFVL